MSVEQFVKKWLADHLSPEACETSAEDQAHFERLLCDIIKSWDKQTNVGVGTDDRCCGNCAHFFYEDTYGIGICKSKSDKNTHCSHVCGEHKAKENE